MTFNLLREAWIPVMRKTGFDRIRPDQILEDDVLSLAWHRPDFTLACHELLIGLLYAAAAPLNDEAWQMGPPTPERLRDRFRQLEPAFNLFGDGSRFLQIDAGTMTTIKTNGPDVLFIDSSSSRAVELNTDVLVKRDRYEALAPAEAAMALYTMQDFAPAGGIGYFTSIRGGGPAVTLAVPGGFEKARLIDIVWANVPNGEPVSDLTAFPWMRKTLPRGKANAVSQPSLANLPIEIFFSMSRRFHLLEFEGMVHQVLSESFGTKYDTWRHPLTPYFLANEDVRPLLGGTYLRSYSDWAGTALAIPDGSSKVAWRAQCVEDYLRRTGDRSAGLLVGGWDMSNSDALEFIWAEQPVFPFPAASFEGRRAFGFLKAAGEADYLLRSALAKARPLTSSSKNIFPQQVRDQFYRETEQAFRSTLRGIIAGEDVDALAEMWLKTIRRQAVRQFDDLCQPSRLRAGRAGEKSGALSVDIAGAVKARERMISGLHGKKICNLVELEPTPSPKKKRKTT